MISWENGVISGKNIFLQVLGLVVFTEGKKQDLERSYFKDRGLEATKRLHISDVSKGHSRFNLCRSKL